LHELGHSVVAQSFGIRVLDITLWPLGGMARMSQIPEVAQGRGADRRRRPIVNFILAAIAAIVYVAQGWSADEHARVQELAWYMLSINVAMGLFNLIPAFSDGRRSDPARVPRTQRRLGIGHGGGGAHRPVFAGLIAIVGVVGLLFVPGNGRERNRVPLDRGVRVVHRRAGALGGQAAHGVVELGGLGDIRDARADWSCARGRSTE